MKRAWRYGLVAVLAAAALTITGALGWLVGTTRGAVWLLDAVSRHSPVKITCRGVEGRILDRLRLTDVRVAWQQEEAEIENLMLRWQPLFLLTGTVDVTELSITGVRIQDNSPSGTEPPDLSWPRISGFPAWVDGRVERLRVDGLTYRRLDEEVVAISSIATVMTWRDLLLTAGDITLVSPSGVVKGSAMAGFRHPSLLLDLTATPTHPLAEMKTISLQARLLHGRHPEQLAGKVVLAGGAGPKRFELAGQVGMTRDSLNFRHLQLSASGIRGTLTGAGTLLLTAQEPVLTLKVGAHDLDLTSELGIATRISGDVTFEGSAAGYGGEFELHNTGRDWRTARISGEYTGDTAGMKLAPITGSLLDGAVQGSLAVAWRKGISLDGSFRGRNLSPARLSPDWKGVVNLDLRGHAAWEEGMPLQGKVAGSLLESRLHGRALTGEVRAGVSGSNLRIDRLALQGKGFVLGAAGELDRRLDFSARVSDLSGLVPGAAGAMRTDGWLRWHKGSLSGAISGQGRNLAAGGVRMAAADLSARLGVGQGYPLHVAAALRKPCYGTFRADSATLKATGSLHDHTVHAALQSGEAKARLALDGGYRRGRWQGEIASFSGRDAVGPWSLGSPAALTVGRDGISLSTLTITGGGRESLEVAGNITRNPLGGTVRMGWSGVNLSRANQWITNLRVTGSSSGSARLTFGPGDRLLVAAEIRAGGGTATARGESIAIRQASFDLAGDEKGMHAAAEIALAGGDQLKGDFASAAPARLAVPEHGRFSLEGTEIDLGHLAPWLPRGLGAEGRLTGRVTGRLLPEKCLDLRGEVTLSGGKGRWRLPDGELNATLRGASVSWHWRGESLSGTVALSLDEHGSARGSFQLPLPARLPTAFDPKGAVRASLSGRFRERGVLTAIFPEVVRESHGDLELDLQVGGQWEEPRIEGKVRLAKAGAYFPTAGIQVKDVQLAAHLEKDLIRIYDFRAVSGPGRIEGNAVIMLKGGRVKEYRGSINGERFQTVYLPELQLLCTPKLKFEGTSEKLTVRGDVRLPEIVISGPPGRPVEPSKDVIMEGAPPAEKTLPISLDIQVGVEFGDKVLVKAEGIDARLAGSLDLAFQSLDRVTSRGDIRVVKGRYKTYGVDLEIVRGRLFYAGGPVDKPTLDILALRTVGDVRAGVTVAGTLQTPMVRLYSEPPMPDVDILAYIVLGHPLGAGGEQAGMVAQAAGFLLSTDQSASLQDRIKNRLGLSTLEVGPGSEGAAGHMGYKPVQVTPPGAEPATSAPPGISETMLTVGKYLTPKLYVSYGRSIFTGSNLLRLRYGIFRRWEVETQTGPESGMDIYYKIEFN